MLCLLLRVVRNTAVLRCAALLVKELSIRKHTTFFASMLANVSVAVAVVVSTKVVIKLR